MADPVSNPYQSPLAPSRPQATSVLYPAADRRIAWRVRIPAAVLLLLSGIQLTPLVPLALSASMEIADWIWSRHNPLPLRDSDYVAFAYGLTSLATLAVFAGAYQMWCLRYLRFCRAAAILACVPILSPGLVVGLPFGIWVTIVLFLPSTEAEYLRIRDPLPPPPGE